MRAAGQALVRSAEADDPLREVANRSSDKGTYSLPARLRHMMSGVSVLGIAMITIKLHIAVIACRSAFCFAGC